MREQKRRRREEAWDKKPGSCHSADRRSSKSKVYRM